MMKFTIAVFILCGFTNNVVRVCGNENNLIKVRHGRRHAQALYDSSSNEVASFADAYNSDRNDAMNNHKPTFTNCSQYQSRIKEEQPTGLFVEQVRATDRDPPERGGTITYSIVTAGQDSMKFHIDSNTGVVTTMHMFNRDEPAREKEIYVTVRATDNGKPQLDDICRFKVIIEDVNDNTPTFDKVEYRESIPQDMKPGSEVMRISATDIDDGDNRLIEYDLSENFTHQYFKVDKKTGILKLDRPISDKLPGYEFRFTASASDKNPLDPKSAFVNIFITVVESNKKPPYFTSVPPNTVHLLENFTEYSTDIATFVAESNTEEKALRFRLVTGKSEQTNKKDTFRLLSTGNRATIRLSGGVQLDYEELPDYFLTVRVENKYNLAAEHSFTIQLEDVNDKFPMFSKEINSGLVLENEPPGAPVMQVSAVDLDVTPSFKKITYSLEDNTDKFDIDPETGNITTKVTFDREAVEVYNIKVVARDGAPSAYDGLPNIATQVFKIDIGDRNDNPPKFKQTKYDADIPENADSNAPVIEVQATDRDSASSITYSILSDGRDNAIPFTIEPETGRIKVKSGLDYEETTEYLLRVKADDGVFHDVCEVAIVVTNVNDNSPVFLPFERNITIEEESMNDECLTRVRAWDPDTGDVNKPQNIKYSIVKLNQQKFLRIDEIGCLTMIKPLDRDYPNGSELWQVLISAEDEGKANEGKMSTVTEVWITLTDINDNAPFLRMNHPVVWRENQGPGNITMLEADDYDTPINGKPFIFQIAFGASEDIRTKFRIEGSSLNALVTFDREEQKEYRIPIAISDSGSPQKTGTSYLTVIIGDENDNPMKEGSSSIFVYLLEKYEIDTQIGRVYVNDPDDWDLPDKNFYFDMSEHHPFHLDSKTGMLTLTNHLNAGSSGSLDGTYNLRFTVQETSSNHLFDSHEVKAIVNVTIKVIPEEAVDKSGSIRFEGVTAEEFINRNDGEDNKADILKQQLAIALNNSIENIDVFTVLHSPIHPNSTQFLDVRFSSHGSPYYPPERINSAIVKHQSEFESALNLKMYMVNVDECLQEKKNCESSCWNELAKNNEPATVYTNTTSFIGIRAYVQPKCECRKREVSCLNGGVPTSDGRCACEPGFDGPYCEQTSLGFEGNGWALYPTFDVCEEIHIVLWVRSTKPDALIFYAGPDTIYPSSMDVQDFIALELRKGRLVLLVDYGTGTAKVEHFHGSIVDEDFHKVEIILKKDNIELKVDNCALQPCMNVVPTVGTNYLLNVNGPLQVGGTYMDLGQVALHRRWTHKPTTEPMRSFSGCVSNFTVNGYMYSLGMPSLAHEVDSSCSRVSAGITFGFDWSFIIAILICLAVMTILLMAVAVHRRKVEDMYKDTDDIRENIINYEDEGGGEGDTAYDMRFLRMQDDDNGPVKCPIIPLNEMDEVPDICGFLDGKKHSVDNDPETLPFDDVRHYAYEGDGNTSGSLSSLASGTDEGDLNFDYLSNFGPRFRKLADMYGEDASDEDSDTYHNPTSESWC